MAVHELHRGMRLECADLFVANELQNLLLVVVIANSDDQSHSFRAPRFGQEVRKGALVLLTAIDATLVTVTSETGPSTTGHNCPKTPQRPK